MTDLSVGSIIQPSRQPPAWVDYVIERRFMSTTRTYLVTGMTCQSCARKVTSTVEQTLGISNVDLDLTTGAITLASDGPINDAEVQQAVENAGYRLAEN